MWSRRASSVASHCLSVALTSMLFALNATSAQSCNRLMANANANCQLPEPSCNCQLATATATARCLCQLSSFASLFWCLLHVAGICKWYAQRDQVTALMGKETWSKPQLQPQPELARAKSYHMQAPLCRICRTPWRVARPHCSLNQQRSINYEATWHCSHATAAAAVTVSPPHSSPLSCTKWAKCVATSQQLFVGWLRLCAAMQRLTRQVN